VEIIIAIQIMQLYAILKQNCDFAQANPFIIVSFAHTAAQHSNNTPMNLHYFALFYCIDFLFVLLSP